MHQRDREAIEDALDEEFEQAREDSEYLAAVLDEPMEPQGLHRRGFKPEPAGDVDYDSF